MRDEWLGAVRYVVRAARETGRSLVVEGTPWLVYEMPPHAFDRRSALSLVFEAEDVVRRVRSFPRNWRDLPDEELFALSWTR